MIKFNQCDGLAANFWPTPNMEAFVKEINNPNCEYNIGLISCGYHYTQAEMPTNGCLGWTGPAMNKLPTTLFDEKHQVLNITFEADKAVDETIFDDLRNTLTITTGGRNNRYNSVNVNKVCNYVRENYQLYFWKKLGFNELFSATKAMIPEITELELFNKFKETVEINRDANYGA